MADDKKQTQTKNASNLTDSLKLAHAKRTENAQRRAQLTPEQLASEDMTRSVKRCLKAIQGRGGVKSMAATHRAKLSDEQKDRVMVLLEQGVQQVREALFGQAGNGLDDLTI